MSSVLIETLAVVNPQSIFKTQVMMDNKAGNQSLQQRKPQWYTLSVAASVHDVLSTQIPLWATKHTHFQKINNVLQSLSLKSLREFLSTLFYHHPHQSELSNSWTLRHWSGVTAFLHGDSKVTMGHVISLIYNHHQSQPKASSVHANDALLSFSTITSAAAIHHAQLALSAWVLWIYQYIPLFSIISSHFFDIFSTTIN